MGLPGKRLSRSSKRRRAAHFALEKKLFTPCTQCKKEIMPHRACPFCGTYKSREVMTIKLPSRVRRMMAAIASQMAAQQTAKTEVVAEDTKDEEKTA